MNHEFWNEIGNLYFMSGAYEPAAHAYLRSIKLDNTFGRSYSNLALVYVQTGKYAEAIKLYHRSIELLLDNKEKAATWNRLGILYRQIKEYHNALEAYQRADLIMPQESIEKASDGQLPLFVSMPDIDIEAILAKGKSARTQVQSNLVTEINAEFEMAESLREGSRFEEVAALPEFENYSESEETTFDPPDCTHSEWRLAYTEEVPAIESPKPVELESVPFQLEDKLEYLNLLDPVKAQIEVEVETESLQPDALLNSEILSEQNDVPEVASYEEMSSLENTAFFETSVQPETLETVSDETSADAVPYPQTEYPLTDLSEEERQSLALEIIKYQQATSKNPRSYILWESLGDAYKSAGQYKDAILAFQKAISMNPTNPMCHYRLGLVFAAERKEQEAIRCFKKVLELDPGAAQAHASLASQYRKMGFLDEAQSHIEKAREMQFEEESDYNHACLEAICGNYEHALELLEIALQSKQTYVTWAQNDPDFDSLRKDQRFQLLLSTHASAA